MTEKQDDIWSANDVWDFLTDGEVPFRLDRLSLNDLGGLENYDLKLLIPICEHTDLALADVCLPCAAAVEMERRSMSFFRNAPPDDLETATDSQLKEWENAREPDNLDVSPSKWDGDTDVKAEFLNSLDDVRSKAVALFDTHTALGPVTREELALLVSASERYLHLLDSMQHAGITTLTDNQQEEIDHLQALMVKVR